MPLKKLFTSPRARFFWLNIAAMIVVVIVLIFATLKGMDVYTHHGHSVLIPDVRGLSTEDAATMFEARGLKFAVSDSSYVKTLSPGAIIDCTPEPGRKVKEGRTIYLTVNTLSVPLYPIPDVADNSSLRQAEARLLSAGFRLLDPEPVPGEKDWVYGVKYHDRLLDEHARVPMGATLVIVVGNGEDELPTDSLSAEQADSLKRARIAAGIEAEDPWF